MTTAGGQNLYTFWRDEYRWNQLPRGGMGIPNGWIASSQMSHGMVDVVGRGDVLVVNPTDEEIFFFISEVGSVEEVLGACANGHKAKARFTFSRWPSGDPLSGVAVTATIKAATDCDPDNPFYEATVSDTTDENGQVWIETPVCVDFAYDFSFTFTVINAAKNGMFYDSSDNVSDNISLEIDKDNPCYCAYPPTPEPAAFQSGYPVKGQVGGVWYHIMLAQPAYRYGSSDPHVGVEYKFENVDDPTNSSGWRNLDNVAGLTFPNGTFQTGQPHQYWVANTNHTNKWTVQYRTTGCPNGGTPSDETPIVNP